MIYFFVFTCLQAAGLKMNAKKSFFGQTELEYLGCYWITCNGIQPLPKKVQAILILKPSTTKKTTLQFY